MTMMAVAENTPSDRREDLLRIAAKLFSEQGFEPATMRQLGKAAGIQPASLYYHFKTKEDILDAIIRDFLCSLPLQYKAIIAHGDSARAILHELIALGFRTSLDNAAAMRIIIHERRFFRQHARFAYVDQTMREIERIWRGVLERGIEQSAFRQGLNLDLTLRMILDLAGSAIEWYRPGGRRPGIDEIIHAQIDFIFHGIVDPPPHIPALRGVGASRNPTND